MCLLRYLLLYPVLVFRYIRKYNVLQKVTTASSLVNQRRRDDSPQVVLVIFVVLQYQATAAVSVARATAVLFAAAECAVRGERDEFFVTPQTSFLRREINKYIRLFKFHEFINFQGALWCVSLQLIYTLDGL